MPRYAQIESSIWEDLEDVSSKAKLLYVYCCSNPNVRDSGMYRLGMTTISSKTGLNKKEFSSCLKELRPKIDYDFENKIMFVAGMFKRRLKGLQSNKNIISALQHDLDEFSSSSVSSLFINKYEGALKGLESLSLPLPLPLPLPIPLINKEEVEKKKNPSKEQPKKQKYGKESLVELTTDEHSKLIAELGEATTEAYICKLENYIGSHGRNYKSHYYAIRSWSGRDKENNNELKVKPLSEVDKLINRMKRGE